MSMSNQSLQSRYNAIKKRYENANQSHVFAYWEKLSESERIQLLDQLDNIDVDRVNSIYSNAIKADNESKLANGHIDLEPLPEDAFDSVLDSPKKEVEWRQSGLRAIAEGQVAVLLMAGGQGTRLGSSAPKGCYDIGLPSKKSLFQLQAERIKRLQTVAEKEFGKKNGSVIIRWYIMTSEPTHDATRTYFGWDKDGRRLHTTKHINFGLLESQVVFFKQGTLPCLSSEGKILLESHGKVAEAPDGNGGLYAALRQPLTRKVNNLEAKNILDDLATHKIQSIHAYCVDNCLVKVADPVFIGYCTHHQAECGTKVVPKAYPQESVGVVARKGHKYGVVEYSEISQAQAEQRDSKTGELTFRAANIVNHFYTTAFLHKIQAMEGEMAFHIARKKIPSLNVQTGEQGKTDGMKLEMFVFDVFPFTEKFAVLEVARNEEFSPLKNALGSKADNPETSRRDLLAQQKRFLEKAGATVEDGVEIELAPAVTYAGEGLGSIKGKTFTKSGHAATLEELSSLL